MYYRSRTRIDSLSHNALGERHERGMFNLLGSNLCQIGKKQDSEDWRKIIMETNESSRNIVKIEKETLKQQKPRQLTARFWTSAFCSFNLPVSAFGSFSEKPENNQNILT